MAIRKAIALFAILLLLAPAARATDSCTETGDVGTDAQAFGIVKGEWQGSAYSFTDSCADNRTLWEFYCTGDRPARKTSYCEHGCTNGACRNSSQEAAAVPESTATSLQPPLPPVEGEEFTVRISKGWNLIGSPLLPSGATVTTDCPSMKALAYDNNAKALIGAPDAAHSYGKWVYSSRACTIKYSGEPLESQEIQLAAGWNLFSVQSTRFTGNGVWTDCNTLSGPWAYDASNKAYYRTKMGEFKQGIGYWIKVAAGCTLSTPKGAVAPQESLAKDVMRMSKYGHGVLKPRLMALSRGMAMDTAELVNGTPLTPAMVGLFVEDKLAASQCVGESQKLAAAGSERITACGEMLSYATVCGDGLRKINPNYCVAFADTAEASLGLCMLNCFYTPKTIDK